MDTDTKKVINNSEKEDKLPWWKPNKWVKAYIAIILLITLLGILIKLTGSNLDGLFGVFLVGILTFVLAFTFYFFLVVIVRTKKNATAVMERPKKIRDLIISIATGEYLPKSMQRPESNFIFAFKVFLILFVTLPPLLILIRLLWP